MTLVNNNGTYLVILHNCETMTARKPTRLKALGARLTATLKPKLSAQKRADPFYRDPAYLAWAAEVKARAGGRCQVRGCETPTDRLVADHIIERKDGGADLDPANGRALCHRHHNAKTAAARRARCGA